MKDKRWLFNGLFMAVVFVITLIYVFKGEDLGEMMTYIRNANATYWIPAVIFVVLYVFCDAALIYYLTSSLGVKIKATHSVIYAFVGYFFSCITPSASGGQPAQAYYMFKDGIPVALSTMVLLIIATEYKLVLVIIALFVMIVRPASIYPLLLPEIFWCRLGLVLNVALIAFVLMLMFKNSITKRWVLAVVRFLGRKNIVKNADFYVAHYSDIMDQYADAADYFRTHMKVAGIAFIITIVQRFLLFSVTYLVYKSLGLSGASFVRIVTLQAMISAAADMLPLPGGMGISEKLFRSIFTPIFGKALLPGMVLSRSLSYYTELLLSAVMTLVAHYAIGRKKNLGDMIRNGEGRAYRLGKGDISPSNRPTEGRKE
ncbi:MAG: flippase-like domain-containing protein [Lachnospiraceae bacterium]|nr:flippase-like domain-containing protein [Lachnospiraceae bacterium]